MSVQFIENENRFSEADKEIIRVFKSLQEEIEATNFYYQRWCLTNSSKELKNLLFHNMLEEIEHTNMLMGYINTVLPNDIKYLPKFINDEVEQESDVLIDELKADDENEEISDENKEDIAVESSQQILGNLIKALEAEDIDDGVDMPDISDSDESPIVESSISRIYQHFTGTGGFFVLSACRDENGDELNALKTQELKEDLKNLRLGYIHQIGGFVETNTETNNKKAVDEVSFFVPYKNSPEKMFDIARNLARKFEQESFIFKNSDSGEVAEYSSETGEISQTFSDFSVNDNASQYFSRLVNGTKNQQKMNYTYKD